MIPTANDELALIHDPIARARCEALREVVERLDGLISEQRGRAQPPVRSARPRAEALLGDLQAACAEEKLKGLIEAAEAAMTMYRREVDAARGLHPTASANGESSDRPQGHQVEQLPTV